MGAMNTGPMPRQQGARNSLADAPVRELFGFPSTVASGAPGQLGRDGVTNVLIFNAGASIKGIDLVARFWAEESGTLDWLEDFLRDPQMDLIVRAPDEADEDDAFEDIEYVKGELTTLGSEEIY